MLMGCTSLLEMLGLVQNDRWSVDTNVLSFIQDHHRGRTGCILQSLDAGGRTQASPAHLSYKFVDRCLRDLEASLVLGVVWYP
jgi:hypothetical protein